MTYSILPLTEDPWQVFTLDLSIDGEAFHAQIETGTCRHRISGFCLSGIMLRERCW